MWVLVSLEQGQKPMAWVVMVLEPVEQPVEPEMAALWGRLLPVQADWAVGWVPVA